MDNNLLIDELKQKINALEKVCGKKVYAVSAVAKQGLFDCLLELNKYITRDRHRKHSEDNEGDEVVKKTWSPV